ncbi:MAG: tetratricopeptide repeat protein [Prosthecobacter sp.]|uniref:tetratricopeptide repeat protein n=1 Tax=Prosthecobacter sp. TaxID=1965333 RepID=UPI002623138F|nr:tetratricopeptide repeat protein [Prosthecobacter sp.]MCF7789241.1 tetratricopeptide repeat protein [Prosthecobacter sp.]
MNIIQQYEAFVADHNYRDALPLIRDIVERAPHVAISHFNLGVCLDELGRHSEAAEAFIKAQEIDIEDWGTHYRIIRSFFLAGDFDTLHEFIDYSCGLSDRVMRLICEDEAFGSLFERFEFQELRTKYLK